MNLANTLIAENADQFEWPDIYGSVASSDHDLVQNTGGDGDVGKPGSGDIINPTDIGLGNLQYNGGPTQTISLLPGSAAIGAGDDSDAPAATDQDGFARITGQHIDIGAYQSGAVAATADLSVSVTGARRRAAERHGQLHGDGVQQ